MSKTKQPSFFKFKVYCIDTSSIINLFRHSGLPYPPYRADIFEGLWTKLDQIIKNRNLISHITVFEEISKRDDEAKRWCEKYKWIFRDIDDCQINLINEIQTKYTKDGWEREISRKGQEWADPWIIALAICEDAIIVSDEKHSSDKIPYIANHFGINTLNLMDFFRDIGLKLKI
jgi:hypothetical protein